ncbi:MAG: GEVED domain-containing protein [Fluviicola sp.]
MTRLLLFLSLFAFNMTVFGQYCMTAGPTSTADSNVELVQISGDASMISHTGCPGVIGVQDLTSLSPLFLTPGNNYSLTFDFGTCGGNFSGAGTVWIDYNQNFVFEATEVVGTWQGIPPAAPSVFNFTVPGIAIPGFSRMRITQQEAGVLPLNPCTSFTWGSVMDFAINIGSNSACDGYDGDYYSDAIPVTSLPYSTTGATDYCYFNQNLVYNSPDIYYRLIVDGTMNNIDVSLCGSNFDTFLSIVDPQGNVIDFNDDGGSCGSGSELTFSAIGQDTVYIIIEGWNLAMGDFTLNINRNSLSVDENNEASFSVYPNPFNDEIKISTSTDFESINIKDVSGKIVHTTSFVNTISTTNLENGIYFIEFISEYKIIGTQQIIKQ